MDYNLPTPKTNERTSRSTSFKPKENESCELLNNAFKSRLFRLIKAYMKQGGSKGKNQKRRKVPPSTFDQYGAYWSADTYKHLKLNFLSLYGSYVQNKFDGLLDTIKENQNNAVPEEGNYNYFILIKNQQHSIFERRRCNSLCKRRANQINRSTFRSDST